MSKSNGFNNVIDYDLLRNMVILKIESEGFTISETAERLQVSAATLSRFLNGQTPNGETFLGFCQWLDQSPNQFTTYSNDKNQVVSSANLKGVLYAILHDESLEAEDRKRLAEWFEWNYLFFVIQKARNIFVIQKGRSNA